MLITGPTSAPRVCCTGCNGSLNLEKSLGAVSLCAQCLTEQQEESSSQDDASREDAPNKRPDSTTVKIVQVPHAAPQIHRVIVSEETELPQIHNQKVKFDDANKSNFSSPPLVPELDACQEKTNPPCTPSNALATSPKSVLKSSLRSNIKKTKTGRQARRVRGLWSQHDSLFAQLHDDTIQFIFSHLSIYDLCHVSMVCHRFKHTSDQCWNQVDATDFVHKLHDKFSSRDPETATERTSKALGECLERHTPERLVIRDIEHRLSANTFLPSMSGLQELVLTRYADLTDTHLHVCLLSAAVVVRRKKGNGLRKLVLDHCSLLTNASVRSIALHCPNIQELSLRGNRRIDNLEPLKDLWKVAEVEHAIAKLPCSQSNPSLQSFFAPPPATPKRALTPSAGLANLFTPPGTSPPRRTSSGGCNWEGKLTHIDISDTRVTAESLLESSLPPHKTQLESLVVSGESWRDEHVHILSKRCYTLKTLEIHGGSTLQLNSLHDSFLSSSSLQRLRLVNLPLVRAGSIAKILQSATNLVELDLEGCTNIVSNDADTVALASVLSNHCGLLRLSFSRCYSKEKQSTRNDNDQRGKVLLDALCQSPSRLTLKELDLTDNWFVTAELVAEIRRSCPKLETIRLGATLGAENS